jgi:iron-sulfur cluster assembly protein
MPPEVTITPAAQKFMRRMVRFAGEGDGAGFRLTVTAGGCSGYDASFSIQRAPLEGDGTLDLDGLRVYLPAASRALLEGTTIDFADTATRTGLTVFNPGATSCACASGAASAAPRIATVSVGAIGRNVPGRGA